MSAGGVDIYLARHGETEWSRSGRHTSRTDLPLTAEGEKNAEALRPRLDGIDFVAIYSSPMLRARRTAQIAGFPDPTITELLSEYDYGDYEGITSADIHATRPGWDLYRDGCPGGESPHQVRARAERFIEMALEAGGPVVAFAHGHILRAIGVTFVQMPITAASRLMLDVATVSLLRDGNHGRVLQSWNS